MGYEGILDCLLSLRLHRLAHQVRLRASVVILVLNRRAVCGSRLATAACARAWCKRWVSGSQHAPRLQIATELRLDVGKVLNHWAICKVSVSDTLSDEELEAMLNSKAREKGAVRWSGMGYDMVATMPTRHTKRLPGSSGFSNTVALMHVPSTVQDAVGHADLLAPRPTPPQLQGVPGVAFHKVAAFAASAGRRRRG